MSIMVTTLPPAGSTSPILAMRYCTRPSRGATQRVIRDIDLVEIDFMLRGGEGMFGLGDARGRRIEDGGRAISCCCR